MARESALQRLQVARTTVGLASNTMRFNPAIAAAAVTTANEPISKTLREAALAEVDNDLIKAGLMDAETRKPSERFIAELSWEREETLPTPGVIVRGCLDECETCEPALEKEIALDLERKKLENKLLERQIDLLEKSQEYRCCPHESDDSDED